MIARQIYTISIQVYIAKTHQMGYLRSMYFILYKILYGLCLNEKYQEPTFIEHILCAGRIVKDHLFMDSSVITTT